MKKAVWAFVLTVTSVECYKLRILNITECRIPDPPIMKNIRDIWSGTIEPYTEHDRILIKGNITVLQDVQCHARIKVIELRKRLQNNISLKGITCRNIIAKMLMQLTHIKFDADECKILKGNYVFKNLDVGRIEQLVTYIPTQKLGYKMWVFALYHDEGSYICYDISVLYES